MLNDLWTSPLLGLTLTLIAYQGGLWIYQKSNMNPLLNPVLIAVACLVTVLLVFDIDYQDYFSGARYIHFLLGPATVALAVPLYQHLQKIRDSLVVILVALLCGSLTAIFSAIGIGAVLGASQQTLLSLAPKSVTTPIAMGIADVTGGLASLTAVFVILTGILGAVLGPGLLNALKITDWRARGLAIGTASHGIGTARALHENEVCGAFSSLAMGLNGLLTAVLVPVLVGLLW
jgi:predicted murein hydrolase (TIGR00659 family)